MKTFSVQTLVRQFCDWVATLDSRPREKRLAIGSGAIAGLSAWFGIALGSPLLLVGVPAVGGLLLAAVKTQRHLRPADGPVELTLDEVALPAAPAWPDEPETSDNLLSRISLAPPPPPVGRTGAAYVYEPEPEPVYEARDDAEDDEPELVGERVYEVCQIVDGRRVVRHTSPSLFGATDYALELHARAYGGEIEVLRARGDDRESVLRFGHDRVPEGSQTAKSLLDLFGYPVTTWRGPA